MANEFGASQRFSSHNGMIIFSKSLISLIIQSLLVSSPNCEPLIIWGSLEWNWVNWRSLLHLGVSCLVTTWFKIYWSSSWKCQSVVPRWLHRHTAAITDWFMHINYCLMCNKQILEMRNCFVASWQFTLVGWTQSLLNICTCQKLILITMTM